VDVGGQQVAQGLVDEAVPGHGGQVPEAVRRDAYMEVAPPVPGASVARVQVAFVLHGQLPGREGFPESGFDEDHPLGG